MGFLRDSCLSYVFCPISLYLCKVEASGEKILKVILLLFTTGGSSIRKCFIQSLNLQLFDIKYNVTN